MSGQERIDTGRVPPKQRRSEMNGIERPELSRHRLRGTIEDRRVNLDELECLDEFKDRGAAPRNLAVRQASAQPQAIQRTKAFDCDQSARYAAVDPTPLRQRIGLPKGDAQQD